MKKIILLTATLAAAVLWTGCGSNARYIQTGGSQSVVTIGQLNDQDFIQAADAATSDLLAASVLERVPNPPAILAMSRIVNDTSQQINIELLTRRIRVALLRSGKAMTMTTFAYGGVEDPLAKEVKQQQDFLDGLRTTPRLPDFTLSGRIIQNTVRAGRTTQSTFTFQLVLTDRQGLGVWESEKQITKQGTRSTVGF